MAFDFKQTSKFSSKDLRKFMPNSIGLEESNLVNKWKIGNRDEIQKSPSCSQKIAPSWNWGEISLVVMYFSLIPLVPFYELLQPATMRYLFGSRNIS